ncbi:MAG: hypothetical protein M1827_001900 [Pycnora praestabilis]|nr:MAG: hypothetical protein M1827_001900 [Pycnora praestabilis]
MSPPILAPVRKTESWTSMSDAQAYFSIAEYQTLLEDPPEDSILTEFQTLLGEMPTDVTLAAFAILFGEVPFLFSRGDSKAWMGELRADNKDLWPYLTELNPAFPFLKLPPEIRNMIYQYVVAPERKIVLAKIGSKTRGMEGTNVAILQVNRQIKSEAASILYEKNILCAEIRLYSKAILRKDNLFREEGVIYPHVLGHFKTIYLTIVWPSNPSAYRYDSVEYKVHALCAALRNATHVRKVVIFLTGRLETIGDRQAIARGDHHLDANIDDLKYGVVEMFKWLNNIPMIEYVAMGGSKRDQKGF